MKLPVIVAAGCLSLSGGFCLAAGEQHIAKGQVWRIDARQADLTLDRLIVEDDARIEISSEVTLWQLRVANASIGQHVILEANGRAGASGHTDSVVASTPPCQNGQPGSHGSAGKPGSAGRTLALNLGVVHWGSLEIHAAGGAGGDGANGAAGQSAGQTDQCESTRGGNGGAGGDGGAGGNGGQVRLSIVPTHSSVSLAQIRQHLVVDTRGGRGGNPGNGGAGGDGSPGYWQAMKTLTGNRQYVAGGPAGMAGPNGKTGDRGRNGVVELMDDLVSMSVKAASNAESVTPPGSGAVVGIDSRAVQPTGLATEIARLQQDIVLQYNQIQHLQKLLDEQAAANVATQKTLERLQKQVRAEVAAETRQSEIRQPNIRQSKATVTHAP